MSEHLFDVATVEPGVRRRFAEDRYAPMRVTLSRRVHIDRGPMVGVDELDDLIARHLEAWGATVHEHHFDAVIDEYGTPDFEVTEHVMDVSLIAESKAQASELLERMVVDALDSMEDDWQFFETRDAKTYKPRARKVQP